LLYCPSSKPRSAGLTGHGRSRMTYMRKVLSKLKLAFIAWLRQPMDEMDRRQTHNEIQPLFPPKE
jgi:hypothetical protein